MNPTELARKIEAVTADYDIHTALTAVEIAKLLLLHRKATELEFNACQRLPAENSLSD